VAFWAAIAVGVTCVLHVALILLCRVYNRHPPPLLEFPRLELLMFLLITQPVGQLAGRGRLLVSSLVSACYVFACTSHAAALALFLVRSWPNLHPAWVLSCPLPAAALSLPQRASCRHRLSPLKLSWPTA
jgi:hypothetical protein